MLMVFIHFLAVCLHKICQKGFYHKVILGTQSDSKNKSLSEIHYKLFVMGLMFSKVAKKLKRNYKVNSVTSIFKDFA